jgi:hypothetical protein
MTVHLYLSLAPEALVASMLPPDQFGEYYAVGEHKKSRGQAMFIEIDPDFRHPFFPIDKGYARCEPHDDGSPKKSVYISTYRVLEHVPTEAFKKFYLVTAYGQVLGLDRQDYVEQSDDKLHLYQEIAPVNPLVVSTLNPVKFYEFITQDPESMIHLPAFAFVELRLGALSADPEHGAIGDLPYPYIHKLRENLIDVQIKDVHTKMVNRVQPPDFAYRVIKNGIFIGTTADLAFYPLPSRDELRSTHYRWWRSANQ